MKCTKLIFVILIVVSFAIFSCSKDSTGPANTEPNPPSNPNPADNATMVSTNSSLSWDCSDPENDPLTYDIYLGTSPNPALVKSGQNDLVYQPDTLQVDTTYYWKVVVHDDNDNSTSGDIWQFKTFEGGGNQEFEWSTIPAGTFTYGQENDILTLDYDYQIMKYHVTNAQYLAYLEAALDAGTIEIDGSYVTGYYPGDDNYAAGTYNLYYLGVPNPDYNYGRISFIDGEFQINVPSGYSSGDFDNHPVVEVTWFGAKAFAQHYGLSLPTEQEWEKAARGMSGYDYPFGNDMSEGKANYWNSEDPWDNGTTPVGYYNGINANTTDSPSPYGVYDMSGNVFDWTDSWNHSTSTYRVYRGGSWEWHGGHYYSYLSSWDRNGVNPTNDYNKVGFRCVFP
ncbi:MAG: SUMF1/EgtB/PvdO family nonheme iron enzyme [Candidatus Cloacimonadales bacterium]